MTHTISKETVEEMKQALKPKEPKKLIPWNIQDHLKTDDERVGYLRAALEEKDKEFIAIALRNIAESLDIEMEIAEDFEPRIRVHDGENPATTIIICQ